MRVGLGLLVTVHLLHLLPVGDVGLDSIELIVVVVVNFIELVVIERHAHVVAVLAPRPTGVSNPMSRGIIGGGA